MIGRGGGGHKASAVALHACMKMEGVAWADGISFVDTGDVVERAIQGCMVRCLPSGDDIYNWFMKLGFYRLAGLCGKIASFSVRQNRGTIESAFEDLWDARRPLLVVSFVPFLNAMMRDSLTRSCQRCDLVTVVTDMESCPSHPWIDPPGPAGSARHTYVVGTDTLVSRARELGHDEAHLIRTSGMVVHPSFYAPPPDAPKAPRPTGVIFFGAFAPSRVGRIVRRALASHPQLDLVVICGRHTRLRRRLQRAVGSKCTVEGFVPSSRVKELFAQAACVIGKPGPGVVSEAGVCGVPFVTERRNVMPQERCVLDYVTSTGVGLVVESLEDLPLDLLTRLDGCLERLEEHSNRAVFEVSRSLRGLMDSALAAKAPPSTEDITLMHAGSVELTVVTQSMR